MASMRHLLVLVILCTLGMDSSAEVVRCADAAGNVSYTDNACPAGASAVGRVAVPEVDNPTPQEAERRRQLQIDSADRASRVQRESAAAVRSQPPQPGGPAIIDSRGQNAGDADASAGDSRWSGRADGPVVIEDGYPYPGAARRPRPPPDLRPRIRDCDARGCRDTLGNHYDRAGRLDRYQGPNGTTCQPVGTTTICR
jgi:hypothetical protein